MTKCFCLAGQWYFCEPKRSTLSLGDGPDALKPNLAMYYHILSIDMKQAIGQKYQSWIICICNAEKYSVVLTNASAEMEGKVIEG